MNTYNINMETGRIELNNLDKHTYSLLSQEMKKKIQSAFVFSRYSQCWVSRSTKNHFTAKRTAFILGFEKGIEVGIKLSYEKQLEIKKEKALKRANKYINISKKLVEKSNESMNEIISKKGDTAYFTQPNINSSSGRSFSRQREKAFNKFKRGLQEYKQSKYFEKKAEISSLTASQSELNDKGYLQNRIDENEKKLNYMKKHGEYDKNYYDEILDKYMFFIGKMEELGGVKYNNQNIKSGDSIKINGFWYKVLKVNPKTVKYTRDGLGFYQTKKYAFIQDMRKKEENN